MAGGHLERDSFYFQKINKSIISGKILSEMFKFNKFRKELLIKKIKEITKKKINKILLVGFSYKESSFSKVNSVFSNLIKNSNFKTKIFDDHYDLDRFKNLDNLKNLKNLKSFDLIIYNYAKNNNIKILDSFLRKNKKKNLLNISLYQKNKFKGPNVHNLFSNEVSEIK